MITFPIEPEPLSADWFRGSASLDMPARMAVSVLVFVRAAPNVQLLVHCDGPTLRQTLSSNGDEPLIVCVACDHQMSVREVYGHPVGSDDTSRHRAASARSVPVFEVDHLPPGLGFMEDESNPSTVAPSIDLRPT